MNFLHLLAALRTPFWDAVFGAVTYLGDETFFIAAALFIFWCVDKRGGYFLLTVDFFGIILNETLKLLFRIPRHGYSTRRFHPWNRRWGVRSDTLFPAVTRKTRRVCSGAVRFGQKRRACAFSAPCFFALSPFPACISAFTRRLMSAFRRFAPFVF